MAASRKSKPTQRRSRRRQHGGDLNKKLWDAVCALNINSVRQYINAGADVNYFKQGTGYVLHELINRMGWYISYDNMPIALDILQLLLEKGANPNIPNAYGMYYTMVISLIVNTDLNNKTVMRILSILFEHGTNPNIQTPSGQTALHYAILEKNVNISRIKLLLEYGASITIKDNKGKDTVAYAEEIRNDAIRKKVLDVLQNTKPTKAKTMDAEIVNTSANNPNQYDVKGYTPLHRLAFSDEPEEVLIEKAKQLLAKGANLEAKAKAKTKREETPVMLALEQNKPQLTSFFLDAGANPNAQNTLGSCLLQYAAESGMLDLVMRLQSMGNDPLYANKEGVTALHYACLSGHLDVVKYLVSQGADVNAKTNNQTITPLIWCLLQKDLKVGLECAEFLLENGADPNLVNPLYNAAAKVATHPFIPLLLRYGADTNIPYWRTESNEFISVLMQCIIQNASLEIVKLLVEAGADVNYVNETNASALMLVMRPHIFNKDIVRYLLEKGADPNKGMLYAIVGNNNKIRTPIANKLLLEGHLDLLPLFLEKGQDPNVIFPIEPRKSGSLMHVAIVMKQIDALKQLLDAGGNANIIVSRQPILHFAIGMQSPNAVKMLLEKGANINAQDADKNTALHFAVLTYNKLNPQEKKNDMFFPNIIKVLLEYGGDKNIKNKDGNIPADLAEDEKMEIALGSVKLWNGWSRSDIAFLNNIFTDETRPISNTNTLSRATDYSLCPVCLKTVERPAGCMHMKHDCATQGGFYHEELYEKYKVDGGIHWCTICNRIGWASGSDFRHYNLGLAEGPKPDKAANSYMFDKDCSVRSGGGGLHEKYHRFNRLRNVALRFNHPAFLGKKSQREILKKLTEAMWDAPFVQDPLYEIQWSEKQWNRPNTNFPLPPIPPNNTTNNNTNIPVPEGVQDPIIHPTETANFANATLVSEKDIIQFRHPDSNGSMHNHDKEGQQISRMAFASWLSDLLGEPATNERFGHCWQFSEAEYGINRCTAKLYPKEVRLALGLAEEPTEGENAEYRQLYKNYRMLFNRKQKGTL